MNEMSWLSIVWAIGALILVGSALAAYRLNWRRSVIYVLAWAAIFALVAVVFEAAGGL